MDIVREGWGKATEDGREGRSVGPGEAGGETEAISKGGTSLSEGVYKWVRERDQGAEEGDQRSPQSSHRRLQKLGSRWNLSENTRAPSPSPSKCKWPNQGRHPPTHRPFFGNYPIFLDRDRPSPIPCHSPARCRTLTPACTAHASPHVTSSLPILSAHPIPGARLFPAVPVWAASSR